MHAFRKNNSFMLSSRNAIIHTYEIFLIFHEEKGMIKKIIAIVVIFVAAVGGVAMLYVTNLLGQVNHVDGTENTADVTGLQAVNATSEGGNNIDLTGIDTNVLSDDDIKNILIIGQDRREGENGRTRSDTMIICSINTKTNKIYLTSLMRDMYVPIPGYGANRINAAYVFGGMDLLDSVIEQDFGVKIDGNVEVDFDGFLTAISELAPLDIELTQEEAEYMMTHPLDGTIKEGDAPWDLHEGTNSLQPGELLEYARMRYVGNSDWDRTERQRKLMKVAFAKLKTCDIFTMLKFAKEVVPTLTTDLTNSEILGYIYSVYSKNMEVNDETLRVPIDGGYKGQSIGGMSVLVPDFDANAEAIQNYIYGKVLNAKVAQLSETDLSEDSVKSNYQQAEELAPSQDEDEYYYNSASSSEESYETDNTGTTVTPTAAPADNGTAGGAGGTVNTGGDSENTSGGTTVAPTEAAPTEAPPTAAPTQAPVVDVPSDAGTTAGDATQEAAG